MALIGAPTTRDHYPAAHEANLRKAYMMGFAAKSKMNFRQKYYNEEQAQYRIVRDAVYAGYGTYEGKAEGAAPSYDSGQEAWTQSYTVRTYALGIQVTKEATEDDPHGVVRWLMRQGGELSNVAHYTLERDVMNTFNTYLTSGTLYTAFGTGYPLLSTAHPRVDGGTWANKPTNDMDLSQEALEFMIAHWSTYMLNQRGQYTMTSPKMLLVGNSDWALAHRLTRTRGHRPGSADWDVNPMDQFDLSAHHNPHLTNDGRWIAFGDKSETGLNFFWKVRPNIERYPDGDNGNARYVGRYRCTWGATHPYDVWGSA